MTTTAQTLFLIDGSNFLFRAFHALPPMTTRAGTPTGAVFGFTNMLLRLMQERQPSHLAVIFDAGGRSVRAELYPAYKANRPPCPPELHPQFELARRLVRAFGVHAIEARDAEADDYIATLARKAEAQGLPVFIVSSDKDLLQLCTEQVQMVDTMKDPSQGFRYGPAEVEEKFGVPPAQLGDVLALMGDSSDNIPGVPGVGPKTAAQLIKQFGSITELLRRIDEIQTRGADKVKAALREHQEQLLLSRRLVALNEQLPTPLDLQELAVHAPDQPQLEALLTELEFQRILGRLRPGVSAASAPAPAAAAPEVSAAPLGTLTRPAPQVIATAAELAALVQRLTAPAGFALTLLHGGAGHNARVAPLCGLGLFAPGHAAYVPLRHRYLGAPAQLDAAEVAAALGPLLLDAAVPKFAYSLKDVYLGLAQLGLDLRGVQADPALCSYLIDPAADHDLAALARRHLDAGGAPLLTQKELLGKRNADVEGLHVAQTAEFAALAAEATYLLGAALRSALPAPARALLDTMELPLARVLAVMERQGVQLEAGVLQGLSTEVEAKLRALEAEVRAAVGYEVNLGSPKQLQELLFEKLQLTPGKKTKTGYSTDAEVLEGLALEHPIVKVILEHRGLAKLKNTYIDQLPGLVDRTSARLHTSYNQVVAATGRLSSTEPNLQNVPIRTELGRQIRRAFVAPPGHLLITADYSQIELRVLAHLSRDPLLLRSFQEGADVHERTAVEMFGEVEGKTSAMRRVAKMINYGIVYGLTDYGLAVRLGLEKKVAKKYIEEYFVRYQGVKAYMDQLVREARAAGGARTLLGRWRPLPEINARNYSVRSYAERMAKNTPIQGTAADILKRAMIAVPDALGAAGLQARMLLTVHDELVLEAAEAEAEAAARVVQDSMESMAGVFKLDVPLHVDVGQGKNWADCG